MLKKFFVILAMFGLMTTASVAAEALRTRDEAKAMVDTAVAYYAEHGLDALVEAVHDKGNAAFHDGELYVFIYDFHGVNVALGSNPAMVGKDLSGLRDENGVMILQEFIAATKDGGNAWVDYHWPNPQTKQIQAKTSYVTWLDDGHFVGVGIYE